MIPRIINGVEYKLPNSLSKFQEELYVHLINYKWKNITTDPGRYKYEGRIIEYDAFLPKSLNKKLPLIYPDILSDFNQHLSNYPFKLHPRFYHMVSSQAANINLFLPILLSSKANDILRLLKDDFKELATSELYKGFRIEYWDGNSNAEKGLLGDHNPNSGTDSDIGIAYYNHDNELCLWLIEHKLTEPEFTTCGGYDSKRRDRSKHLCTESFSNILKNKNLCYYHDVNKYNYWNITETHKDFFVNNDTISSCPFRRGMNQLWRNQLLGFAVEDDKSNAFKNVFFSVVHHPDNHALDDSTNNYKELINNNPKFSSFTSQDVIEKAETVKDKGIASWVKWYKELYKV